MEIGLDAKISSTEMNFYVEGVRCAKCVHKLEHISTEHDQVSESRFNKSTNLLTLNSLEPLSPEQAIEWIEAKGYKAFFVESSAQTDQRRRDTQRRWLTRLAVTFFFASNLMMFAIALYMGAYGEWSHLFAWLCGILFLPIVFYSALPFYQSAWQALKDRRFSADLAIVIAFGWGTALSYFNLFRGSKEFYFDSSASFLFLILLARYFLDRAQNSIESDLNPSLLFKNSPFFRIRRANEDKKVLYHQIQPGDELNLNQGQTLPVDLTLVTASADIDTSLFSGESLPQTFYRGQSIKAGTIVLSSNLEGTVLHSFPETELNRIFEGVIRNRHEKTKAHTRAEVYSQWLLTTVSVLSVLVLLIFGIQGHWEEGFRRALALFTIACPCALALAIPLASVVTLKRAMSEGIFVKSPLFFEKLKQINGIVFDKTGTLTSGQLEFFSWEPREPQPQVLQILLAMEQPSHHPIAQSLSRILLQKGVQPISLQSRNEVAGVGVDATYEGQTYRIRRLQNSSEHPQLTGFELHRNEDVLGKAYFKDHLRTEAKTLIKKLRKLNLDVYLLSGDRRAVVDDIGRELALNSDHLKAEMSPSEKAEFLRQSAEQENKKYLMIGDGHNDALALSKSYVSLAVKGCAETSLRAADAYSQKSDLSILLQALKLSHFYHRLITQNVLLSLTYNLVAGTMAIAGFVDPLMAAVLMPINSLLVIGATVLAQPIKTRERK